MKLAGGIHLRRSNKNQTADTHPHHHHYVLEGDRRIMLQLYSVLLYKTPYRVFIQRAV